MGDIENVNLRTSYHNKLRSFLRTAYQRNTTPLTYDDVVLLQERSKEYMRKLEEVQDRLLKNAEDESALKAQEDFFDIVEANYRKLEVKLRQILVSVHNPAQQQSSSQSTQGNKTNVKLPKIDLQTFDGTFINWPSFKDLFTSSIGSNNDLSGSQKLQYLKASLQNDPATLIKSIVITDANYEVAWNLLSERYDNKREIVFWLLNKMLSHTPLSKESASGLQTLMDTADNCLQSLKTMQRPVDTWDDVIVFILSSKLDNSTRREWAISLKNTEIPTLQQFRVFLQNHIRGLQANIPTTATTDRRKWNNKLKSHHVQTKSNQCSFCKDSHFNYQCDLFISKPVDERIALAKQCKVCYNCLHPSHSSNQCKSKRNCSKCNRRHHTMLHDNTNRRATASATTSQPQQPEAATSSQQTRQVTFSPPPTSSGTIIAKHASLGLQVLLATAVAYVYDAAGIRHTCRLFLDGGSEGTFITESLAQLLGIKRSRSNLRIQGIGRSNGGTTRGKVRISLTSLYDKVNSIHLTAHVLPHVTQDLPRMPVKEKQWPHLQELPLADPAYHEPGPIDLLIGQDYLHIIRQDGLRKGPSNSPIAENTIFGWVLSGKVETDASWPAVHHLTIHPDVIERFWRIEEIPKRCLFSEEEKQCEAFFTTTTTRDAEGRFNVRVPFTDQLPKLGLSRAMAIKRLDQVWRKLQRDPSLQQQYSSFITEYEALGHMEKISPSEIAEIPGKTYYLSHHGVINHNSTTTNLRVVFDASAKTTTNLSLNDVMMVGPTIQLDLMDILLRFRLHPIVIKADITKMFRQFRIHPEDADLHRIVWRPGPGMPLEDYRLTTVTYGTACAPYLATKCVQELGISCANSNPIVSSALKRDTYVDDIMSGGKTDNEVIDLYVGLTDTCKSAQLTLRKWASNSLEVMKAIPPELHDKDPLTFDDDTTLKALGMQWAPVQDNFSFKYVPVATTEDLTKRILLSDLAKVFDPIGIISPITVRGKLLLQELWKMSLGWDDPVPVYVINQWNEYQEDLKNISQCSVPRCLVPANYYCFQLHGFSDASEKAYGAAVYLTVKNSAETISSALVTGKSKVAPLRQISLPRLELQAAVMLAELTNYVMDTLQLQCPYYLWTDSTIVLTWITQPPKKWKTYVANRVAIIQELTKIESWNHVPGVLNPADLVSRGVAATNLINEETWWKGPAFICEKTLPSFSFVPAPEVYEEERTCAMMSFATTVRDTHPLDGISTTPDTHPFDGISTTYPKDVMDKFSSLRTLKRVTAYMLRLPRNLRRKKEDWILGPLTQSELNYALICQIRRVQQQFFAEDIKSLKKSSEVGPASKLKSLYPYLDLSGVLRVTGRLANSDLPEEAKHQAILPSSCHFTDLVIHHHHLSNFHAGFQLTWSSIRQQFWIVNGRNKIRHLIRSCVICRRHAKKEASQLMGSLPQPRTVPNRPFLHCGVDYAGPYLLKNPVGRAPKTYKGYLCIFVCFSTKAVHIELASSLSTEDFIVCLRRFVSRRAISAHIYSDCGTNFVGADRELKALLQSEGHQKEVQDAAVSLGIEWHFNVPSAPHHGGIWEAAVKSAKHHLRRVIGDAPLTYEQMSTLLCQIEACLNSRPLYPMSSDPADLEVLTPGHFLVGAPLNAIPDDVTLESTGYLNQYRRQQQRLLQFWNRWKKDYLHTLQQRSKWMWKKEEVKEGDLVLIMEDTPPTQWRMARVISQNRGKDNLTRTVKLKTQNAILERPIVKLVVLLKVDE